jgi:hypothetical protein
MQLVVTTQNEENTPGKNFEFFSFGKKDNFENVLNEIREQSSLLDKKYQQVKIVWSNSLAQCVPSAVFSEEIAEAVYQNLKNGLTDNKNLLCKNSSITLPYLVNRHQFEVLASHFIDAEYTHKYLEIINHFENFSSSEKTVILVVFYQGHFIICAKQNNQLQFINSLDFSSGTDAVYHILNAVKQLNAEISETRVILSGLIDGDSPLFNEIYKYVPIIDVDATQNALFLNSDFSEYPSHYFVPFFKYV